jgi:hypothetical protein
MPLDNGIPPLDTHRNETGAKRLTKYGADFT